MLLVEDDPDLRLVTRTLLQRKGFRVEVAADGKAAIASMTAIQPDVVIADIEMPGMGGLALLAWLRSSEGLTHVPVILLSGQTPVQPAQGAHFLLKPYALDELVTLVGQVVAAR